MSVFSLNIYVAFVQMTSKSYRFILESYIDLLFYYLSESVQPLFSQSPPSMNNIKKSSIYLRTRNDNKDNNRRIWKAEDLMRS